jgi:hypothetical protein
MRTMNAFLLGGILLLALSLLSFLYAAIHPDGGDSVRALPVFGTPFFPAMMGLVLIVAGYAAGLLSRASWDTPQIA